MDELKLTEPNEDQLRKLLEELEFKSFTQKILKKTKTIQKPANGQLDLFADLRVRGRVKLNFRVLRR
jgi:DNA polymerase-1